MQREEEKLEGTCQLYAHKSTFKLIRGGNAVEKSYLVLHNQQDGGLDGTTWLARRRCKQVAKERDGLMDERVPPV